MYFVSFYGHDKTLRAYDRKKLLNLWMVFCLLTICLSFFPLSWFGLSYSTINIGSFLWTLPLWFVTLGKFTLRCTMHVFELSIKRIKLCTLTFSDIPDWNLVKILTGAKIALRIKAVSKFPLYSEISKIYAVYWTVL